MNIDAYPPLDGVRVLDASRVLAGPLCGQVLGDLGAEVIKVERPGAGDDTRAWGPPFAGPLSAYFLSCNRNKKGMTLDLACAEGLEIFYDLAKRSDILLENFRAVSASKLGLSPQALHGVNPRLIICSISGFGRTGPLGDLPGYDFAIQGLSGFMNITGPVAGPPCKVGVAIADVLTGLNAAIAVLACLHARKQSDHGYHIDLALLDCAVAAQVNLVQAYLTSGQVPPRQGNAHLQIVPYQSFATADDWIILAIGNDGQWHRFCQAAERPDLAGDARFASNTLRVQHRDVLIPVLEVLFRSRPSSAWLALLEQAEIPQAPVWDYAQLFGHPQAAARGLRISVRDPAGNAIDLAGSPFHISGTTLPPAAAPPTLGQHTDEILGRLLDLPAARIDELKKNGVI
ncbi:MAG: CoA transferase [Planctomycetes bacterium]|nr:CoA transferase [Planctomycetota bacterium]